MKRINRRTIKGIIVFMSEARGKEECMSMVMKDSRITSKCSQVLSMGKKDSRIVSKCSQVLSAGDQLPKAQHTVITGCLSKGKAPEYQNITLQEAYQQKESWQEHQMVHSNCNCDTRSRVQLNSHFLIGCRGPLHKTNHAKYY